MKMFYVGSKQSPEQKYIFLEVAKILENAGHKMDSVFIDEKEITTSFNFEKNYQKNINAIKKADYVITEISNMSSGLFFLIASALNEKKPVLALNNTKASTTSGKSLSTYSAKNKFFTYKEYDKNNLSKEISQYIVDVKKIIDTKFILIISPQIDQYLEWASINRRMHKAQVVRRAVEQIMVEDKEYKKQLNKVKRNIK